MLGCSPNGQEAGGPGLKRVSSRKETGAAVWMCCLHTQQHPQEACSRSGVSQRRELGGAGHLDLLAACNRREGLPQEEICVPLERKNGCWAARKWHMLPTGFGLDLSLLQEAAFVPLISHSPLQTIMFPSNSSKVSSFGPCSQRWSQLSISHNSQIYFEASASPITQCRSEMGTSLAQVLFSRTYPSFWKQTYKSLCCFLQRRNLEK